MSNQKTVAILQSNYIPWKGYFDLIRVVDEFIILDDVQYTKRDWRNRNQIKSPKGLIWLTIPVSVKGRFGQRIMDVTVSDPRWKKKHWKTIRQMYAKAAFFKDYGEQLEALYLDCNETYLSMINYHFISGISRILGIQTKLSWSMDYPLLSEKENKTDRLIHLCRQTNATKYLCGPRSKDYIEKDLFRKAGIHLQYFDYSDYPEYRQLYPPFQHQVSIIDLMLNEGPHAGQYLKGSAAYTT